MFGQPVTGYSQDWLLATAACWALSLPCCWWPRCATRGRRKLPKYFEAEAPVEQVYAYWRDFSHCPAFMPDVEEVTVTSPTTTIEVSLEYHPPGGKAGELVAVLVKHPDKQVQRAVENFRLVVERGGLGVA